MTINDKKFKMQIDTGASILILPKNSWMELSQPKLKKCTKKLRMYDGSHLKARGELEVVIEQENKFIPATFIITEATKSHGLIGTDLIDMEKSSVTIQFLKYEELGKINNYHARIRVKKDVRPATLRREHFQQRWQRTTILPNVPYPFHAIIIMNAYVPVPVPDKSK